VINTLTISGGNAGGASGAGIMNDGTLTLANVTLFGNAAPAATAGRLQCRHRHADQHHRAGNSAGLSGGGVYNDEGST